MKRVTVLSGTGRAGKLTVRIESEENQGQLMRSEHDERHNDLVQEIHEAMAKSGCYQHQIKVK